MTELNFKGKEFVFNHHLAVPFRPLVPDASKGIGGVRMDGNLIIQGDNLHALKALLPMYAGKVDCIFIDPPYNTGNEGWAYNDNVNAPMIKEWLAANPIGIEDGLRHDKWCAMMWPRLRLLHELLSDEGSFWMTLDENEFYRGKGLLDEIFGEQNCVATVAWQNKVSPANDAKYFSDDFDYLVCFAKNKPQWKIRGLERTEGQSTYFTNVDDDARGPWNSATYTCNKTSSERPNLYYAIKNPFNGKEVWPKKTAVWRFSKERHEELEKDDRLYWGVNGDAEKPRLKLFLSEAGDVVPRSVWPYKEVGHTQGAMTALTQIMQTTEFQTPKPVELLLRVLRLALSDRDALILDSFAGSGTTAHAVLEMNKRDGGNRKFILVEMEDYADKLTAERVRRVINGYDFTGTQRTELLRERLNWSKLQKADKLTEQVEKIENLHAHEYDKIKKEVKDGELIVTGEKAVKDRAEGLGGEFTYCILGEPVDLDRILTGDTLPAWDALGAVLFHTATSQPMDAGGADEGAYYLGQTDAQHLWLIYRPDLDWLKTPDAALSLSFAQRIAAEKTDKPHLVFAPARHVSQKMLDSQNIPVEFVPLPFALYRIGG
ncbi:MAG: site-specific DNA-methyltransferase [Loktanella sp.]|nr:site-specific DNA-methyltransferase [Loktanella sp.]